MDEPARPWETLLRRLVLIPIAAAYVLASSFLGHTIPVLVGERRIMPSLPELSSLWFFDGWTTATAGFLLFTIGSVAVGALAIRLAVTWGRWASVGIAGLSTWLVYTVSFALTYDAPFPLFSRGLTYDLGMGAVLTPLGGALGLLFASLAPLVVARTVPAEVLGPTLHPPRQEAEGFGSWWRRLDGTEPRWPRPFDPLAVGVATVAAAGVPTVALGGAGVIGSPGILFFASLSIAVIYLLTPILTLRASREHGAETASLQTATALAVGVLVLWLFFFSATLATPSGPDHGYRDLFAATFAPGLLAAVAVAELAALETTDDPTPLRGALQSGLEGPIAWGLGIAAGFLGLTSLGMGLSQALFDRIDEPFVTGSFLLAYSLAPVAVARLRREGTFEGNGLLVVLGPALAALLAWVAWWLPTGLADLGLYLWAAPMSGVLTGTTPYVVPYVVYLFPGVLLSLGVLRWRAGRSKDGTS